MQTQHKQAKLQMNTFVGSLVAASGEKFFVYPLDLLKTRFQSSCFKGNKGYRSIIHAFKTIRTETGIRSLYRGLCPSLLSVLPLMTTRGASYIVFKESGLTQHASGSIIYGIIMGGIESLVITPFDAVKISLQTNRYCNATEFFKSKKAKQITLDLYRGLGVTALRQIVYATGSVSAFRYYHQKYSASLDEDCTGFAKLRTGVMTSVVATLAGAPLDVLKTRIQNNEIQRGSSAFRLAFEILTKEGAHVLYSGAGTKLIRVSIGTFLCMCIFEAIVL